MFFSFYGGVGGQGRDTLPLIRGHRLLRLKTFSPGSVPHLHTAGGQASGHPQCRLQRDSACSFRPTSSPRGPWKWFLLRNPGCGREGELMTHLPATSWRKAEPPGLRGLWCSGTFKQPTPFRMGKLRQGWAGDYRRMSPAASKVSPFQTGGHPNFSSEHSC